MYKTRFSFIVAFLFACITVVGCSKSVDGATPSPGGPGPVAAVKRRPASIGIIGDSANVDTPVNGGMVLMGGGTDVEAAFKWMIDRSGGGDVVIIRVSGTDAYNPFVNKLGQVNSVETLKIDTKELADNDTVANIIRNAEMLFIAGGDQSDYMNLWRNTKTGKALNYLLQEKKVPFGGTSAGCAILSGFYFSGEQGSVVSADALANPYIPEVTLYNNDFLHAPFLANVLTDQHYLTRGREGRQVAFLGRIYKDWNVLAKGIAADEKTAICIDKDGKAQVFGSSKAYFIIPDAANTPEQVVAGKPLIWNRNQQALSVYEITGSVTGNGNFNVGTFNQGEASGGAWYWWSANNNELTKTLK
ncbi:MAG: cyanophycinase [Pedobacter sp.]|nr:MAG: cyanophycinase [Pedobacter sp.]